MNAIVSRPLAVLNPGGRDAYINYAGGPGTPEVQVHPPVNFHAYAAATRGAFFDSVAAVAKDDKFPVVLLLIRHRTRASLLAARELKSAGKKLLVAWKECGAQQIQEQLHGTSNIRNYREILSLADAIISPTEPPPPVLDSKFATDEANRVYFIPTPYPVDIASWNRSVPVEQRSGILLGTRDFTVGSRNHKDAILYAIRLARDVGCSVTIVNGNGHKGLKQLEAIISSSELYDNIKIIRDPLPYVDYLALMASHRVVLQLDASAVPGQVAGDALLCRTLCIGGNSTVERLAFPQYAPDKPDFAKKVREILTDDHAYCLEIEASQTLALERISFSAVARDLTNIIDSL